VAHALVNARIHPMATPSWPGPDGRPWEQEASAILFGDAVELVGSDAAVAAEAHRRGIPTQDLGGRPVLPGFVDAHTHFLHIGVKRSRPDLAPARSLDEALGLLAAWLREHPGPGPVIAERWDESSWPGRSRPTRDDIDRVVGQAAAAGHGPPDRPVVMRRVCGHVAVAGSAALALVRQRWQGEAVDPETGLLLEQPSLYLNEVIPVPPRELDEALGLACAESLALGITAVGDYSQAPYREALRRAAAAGRLPVRVASSIYVQQLDAEAAAGMRTGRPAPGPGGGPSRWLRDGGLKVFLDGSLGGRTAALREPYLDVPPGMPDDCGGTRLSRHGCVGHPHPQGTLNWGDADVERLFRQAHAAGIQVHAHAIGDAAIDQGLEAFARLAADAAARPAGKAGSRTRDPHADPGARPGPDGPGEGPDGLRSRFEHYEIHHDAQVEATARLGIVASSQPNFVGSWSAKGGMYEERLGPRYRLGNRFRTLKRMGVRLAFGSDGMPPGPLLGLQAAVAHPEPDERLEPLEAAWHYTWASAWSLHWEDAIGSLEPGKEADLVVLDAPRRQPQDWKVAATFTGGVRRHPA
jgi:predicted amidohydrolase YtcJ